MKIFSNPLSWIYLLIPGLIFIYSFFASTMPGGLFGIYLIGIVFCLPSIGFSVGWMRWSAIAMALVFIVASYTEHESGLRHAKSMGEKMGEYKLKNQ